MKKRILSMLLATSLLAQLRADEGMWLMTMLEKLNYKDMKKAGVKLTPEQIYRLVWQWLHQRNGI
jgi:hypothetical protein